MSVPTNPILEAPTEDALPLLANVPDGLVDVFRDYGPYKIQVIFLPDLKQPEEAFVTILDRDNKPIDTLKLKAKDGVAVVNHPCWFSRALIDYLRELDKPTSAKN